ncbi:MAG: NAD-dependent epimerase/dehydratase family protein [Candidatus Lokiarchaeota archaeon]|nr:NAD-dependent epimerase/dehydratase family protein [Candidatus Lokiarchaeota archaeon]
MKVMVTGGLGGLGQYITQECINQKHDVTIFDLKTRSSVKIANRFPKGTVCYGDIMKPDTYQDLIPNLDAIIHLAFILPPMSEKASFARNINVEGTKLLVESIKELNPDCRLIFASSVSLYGPTTWYNKDIIPERNINPTDNYTRHKAECESIIRNSGLEWLILRIAEAMYLSFDLSPKNLERMYDIPYNQRVEFIHPKDVALAFANAVSVDAKNEVFNIAGGVNCRMLFHEQIDKIFETLNLPPAKPNKFSTKTYYLDYYNTEKSQKLLKYQNRDFEDWIEDFKKEMGRTRDVIAFFAPIAKFFL